MPEIFHYGFMLRAFGAGLAVAAVAPVIGTFLAVRRGGQLPDALAHASFLGVALALLFRSAPLPWALAAAVLAAAGIELARGKPRGYGEMALPIFASASLGLASVAVGLSRGFDSNVASYLFGSVATVSPADLAAFAALAAAALGTLARAWKPLFLCSLDEDLAAAGGIPVRRYRLLLSVAAAVTVGLAVRVTGALLVGALTTVPVAAALQLRLGFKKTAVAAVAFASAGVVAGLTASFYLDVAPGGSVVVALLLALGGAAAFRKMAGR